MASQSDKDTAAAQAKQNNKNQAAIDTAAAKAKQGGGQAAIDTAAAKAKQNNSNQAAKDTAAAKAKQNGGDGGTSDRMSKREEDAGLNLAGNDPTSGRGLSTPTMSGREIAAGLTLAGNNPISGSDPFYENARKPQAPWVSFDTGSIAAGSDMAFKDDDTPTADDTLYAFKVVYEDGSIVVTPGSLNSESGIGGSESGSPTQLWLKATIDSDGDVTAGTVVTSSGSDSATAAYAMIASITWANNTPTIVQHLRGHQSVASCGGNHQWTSHY